MSLDDEIAKLCGELDAANAEISRLRRANDLADAEREKASLRRTALYWERIAQKAEADLLAVLGLVERWLRQADAGHWRDPGGR